MKAQVLLKTRLPRKGQRTFGAVETALPLMTAPHVKFQVGLIGRSICTHFALVVLRRWNVAVDAFHVPRQIGLQAELLSAFVAREFRILEVRRRVSLQITETVETSIALLAAEPMLFLVNRGYVFGQATLLREPLLTHFTTPLFDLVVKGLHMSA